MVSPHRMLKTITAHVVSVKTDRPLDDVLPLVDSHSFDLPLSGQTFDRCIDEVVDCYGLTDSAPSDYREEFMAAVESGVWL